MIAKILQISNFNSQISLLHSAIFSSEGQRTHFDNSFANFEVQTVNSNFESMDH